MKHEHTLPSEREAALDILMEVLEEGRFSGSAIDRKLREQPRSSESRAFLTRLCEGTIERLVTIDEVLDSCASVKVRKMKPVIRTVLRESVYQMLFMDNVEDAVAVNEAVTLTKKRGYTGLAKFVNGVLRTVERRKGSFSFYTVKENRPEVLDDAKKERRSDRDLSVYYAIPLWLVHHMENAAGKERAEAVFRDFLTVRPLQARINRSNAEKSRIVKSLTAEGVRVSDHPYLENVICLEGASRLTRTEAFREGWIQIQDASSVLAVAAAGVRPGMRILDVCAAPGGKSLYAADLLGSGEKCASSPVASGGKCGNSATVSGKGKTAGGERETDTAENAVSRKLTAERSSLVLSRDLTEAKVQKIRENAVRCHFEDILRPEVADARIFDPALEAWADIVIADLPCSGLGVIAKKPDIKNRVQPGDLKSLAALQREILSVVWRYVKPGGVLIYSTCTVNPGENQENVRWFLSQGYPMEADDMAPCLPESFLEHLKKRQDAGKEKTSDQICELQLLPGEYETDGFFIARFRRSADEKETTGNFIRMEKQAV